jgi:hypothetical protein
MSDLKNELQSVPAVSKQELLFYIAVKSPLNVIRIITISGAVHTGVLKNIGSVKNTETNLVLQIMDERSGLLHRFVHLDVHRIESIEIVQTDDIVKLLSLGKIIKNLTYEASGKLEVQRAFQKFAATILEATTVNVEIPKITLPEDGLKLNRILKLTGSIQVVLIELLQQQDARENWATRFKGMAFVQSDDLQVKQEKDILEIHFPFENLNAPEIAEKELMHALLTIL